VKLMHDPSQTDVCDCVNAATGNAQGLTVTVTLTVSEQVPSEPMIEYVVVDEGLAVTVLPVVALSPVPGDHV
jgi:hypothetical protein